MEREALNAPSRNTVPAHNVEALVAKGPTAAEASHFILASPRLRHKGVVCNWWCGLHSPDHRDAAAACDAK